MSKVWSTICHMRVLVCLKVQNVCAACSVCWCSRSRCGVCVWGNMCDNSTKSVRRKYSCQVARKVLVRYSKRRAPARAALLACVPRRS